MKKRKKFFLNFFLTFTYAVKLKWILHLHAIAIPYAACAAVLLETRKVSFVSFSVKEWWNEVEIEIERKKNLQYVKKVK